MRGRASRHHSRWNRSRVAAVLFRGARLTARGPLATVGRDETFPPRFPRRSFPCRSSPPILAAPAGWVSLFDGKSLDGWKASDKEGTFSVADGEIIVHGTALTPVLRRPGA